MALVAVSAIQLHSTSVKEVTKLAADCKNGAAKACEKLEKIASEDKDGYIRESAIRGMTDQPTLAQIAIAERQEGNALLAIGEITDQTLLAKVALEGTSKEVRLKAAGAIVDKELLNRLVSTSSDSAVRALAEETLDWMAADSIGTVVAYAGFLGKHPDTNRLQVQSETFTVDHFSMISNSNSVSAGPGGEIVPTNFQTTVVCEVMKDGESTGETITLDDAEKRGFVTRDPKTGMATAVYKLVQRQLYKRANGGADPGWVLVGDMEVLKEPDR
jgi:hypothetical protein